MKDHPPLSRCFDKLSEARFWASSIESKIRSNKLIPELESSKHTLKELIDSYLQMIKTSYDHQFDYKQSHLSVFEKKLGGITLASISKSHFNEVVQEMLNEYTNRGKKRETSTVARYLSTMNHCINYAVNQLEWMPENPLNKLPAPPENEPKNRYLLPEELKKLIESSSKQSDFFMGLVLILVSSALRIGEALDITPNDFEFETNSLIIRKTKNKKIRRVDLHGMAAAWLNEKIKKNKCRGKSWKIFGGNTKSNYQKMRRKLIKSLDDAGIKNFTFHGTRHTTASYLAMNGSQLQDIMKVLGHGSMKMAQRYTHLMENYTSKKVKDLSENVITPILETTKEKADDRNNRVH